MTGADERPPVLIVGAGPTGTVCALVLARFGVRSVVLEAAAGPEGVGSKAICVQRDVLSALERLGVGDALAERGVSWTLGRTYFRDREVFTTRFPEADALAFPPFVNVSQADTEVALHEAVAASGLVSVRWGTRVTGVEQDGEGVTLVVEGPDGRGEVRGSHLVGCDGGRSTVRETLGIGFPGHQHEDRFIIADIRAQLPFPNERRFFFDPPFNPGRQVLVHPQPDDVWRIDWQVPRDVDAEEERANGGLDRRIRAVIGNAAYELVWVSTYRFQQKVADVFRRGRAFLAGDAAHLMAPFGARGMNSGIADAENLAWKLALVVRGEADETLLATYETERRAAARENVAVTDATMRFMVPRTPAHRMLRSAVLRASVHAEAVRAFVNSGRLAEPFTYERSPLTEAPSTSPERSSGGGGPAAAFARRLDARTVEGPVDARPGALAPDAACRVVGEEDVRRLRSLFGDGFTALWFNVPAVLPALDAKLPLQHILVRSDSGAAEPRDGAIAIVAHGEAMHAAYRDTEGSLPAMLLVRPDGYVAARRQRPPDTEELARLLAQATGSQRAALPLALGTAG